MDLQSKVSIPSKKSYDYYHYIFKITALCVEFTDIPMSVWVFLGYSSFLSHHTDAYIR